MDCSKSKVPRPAFENFWVKYLEWILAMQTMFANPAISTKNGIYKLVEKKPQRFEDFKKAVKAIKLLFSHLNKSQRRAATLYHEFQVDVMNFIKTVHVHWPNSCPRYTTLQNEYDLYARIWFFDHNW